MSAVDTIYLLNDSLLIGQTAQNSQSTNFFISHFSEILSFIEVCLIGIYVYFTIKTFNEHKKQTDLQLKAYLSLSSSLLSEANLKEKKVKLDGVDKSLSNDWKESMEKTFPKLRNSDIFNGGFYTLEISNYGNVEIKSFEFKVIIVIKNSKELINSNKLTPSETKELTKKISRVVTKGETYYLPLFSTAAYPIFEIKVSGTYQDVRGEEYNIETLGLKGENKHLTLKPSE